MINNIFLIKFSELYPIGKFKYAPGTTASLFTCIIFFYLNTGLNGIVVPATLAGLAQQNEDTKRDKACPNNGFCRAKVNFFPVGH